MPKAKTIRMRLDRNRPVLIPVVGDVLSPRPDTRWRVVGRELLAMLDQVNEELWVEVVVLDLEPMP